MLGMGAVAWLRIDATEELIPDELADALIDPVPVLT